MENRYLEVIKRKETITSLELLEQINFFRKQEENKTELGHNDLLKIIRNEFEEEIGEGKISHGSYKDKQNQSRPMFVLTLSQSKQVLMRESKFVRKAVIQYIEKLELELKKPLSTEDLIILQAESIKDVKGRVDVLEDKINKKMTVESREQNIIHSAINRVVYKRVDQLYSTEEEKKIARKLIFPAIHKEFRNKFGIVSYKDVRVSDYEDSLLFIKSWREDQNTRDRINKEIGDNNGK